MTDGQCRKNYKEREHKERKNLIRKRESLTNSPHLRNNGSTKHEMQEEENMNNKNTNASEFTRIPLSFFIFLPFRYEF